MDREKRSAMFWPGLLPVIVAGLLPVVFGCSVTSRVTSTQRSAVEQQLLVRSLERALQEIDVQRFQGKTVHLELHGLTGDRDFAKEFVAAWLAEHGVRSGKNPDQAALRLKVFATVLGVDRSESLLGIPSFQAPVLDVPFPEIALFKWVRHQGQAEIRIYALDGETGKFVGKNTTGAGKAKYDQYTILLLINFTSSDLEESAGEQEPQT